MYNNSIVTLFDDLFGRTDFLKAMNDFKKQLDKEIKKLNKEVKEYKDDDVKKNREYSFEYNEPLTPEDKKRIVVTKMNKYSSFMKLDENKEYDMSIKFKFDKDEIFYFYWDKDIQKFTTTDPNGDEFYYDDKDETLVKIIKTEEIESEKKDKAEEKPESEKKDVIVDGNATTATSYDPATTDVTTDVNLNDEKRYNFEVKDDKNLAFNLKNSLAEWKKNNPCDDYGKLGEEFDDFCYFCPVEAADAFKELIIDSQVYGTDFDDAGNPYQIRFDIDYFLSDFDDFDEYQIALNDIYHTESQNLDRFCELIKDKYNFSLGSWNVSFEDDDRDNVETIEFIFTF